MSGVSVEWLSVTLALVGGVLVTDVPRPIIVSPAMGCTVYAALIGWARLKTHLAFLGIHTSYRDRIYKWKDRFHEGLRARRYRGAFIRLHIRHSCSWGHRIRSAAATLRKAGDGSWVATLPALKS